MKRVYLLVEGQTEEVFVRELLQPHCALKSIYLTPILVETSPGFRGGMGRYAKLKPQIEKLCKGDTGAHTSTMFDLYALPKDFPGKASPDYAACANGQSKADHLENALAKDISLINFIPNLMVHEFEALLFSEIDKFESWADEADDLKMLRSARQKSAPEEINDAPTTAPSKRILKAIPKYQKTVHGPLIALEIGLGKIRAECPHFDQWLMKIEALRG